MGDALVARMAYRNGRTQDASYDVQPPYAQRGDDRNRDRDPRGALRDDERGYGYQDSPDWRSRDSWRTDDLGDRRIDQRFDYGGDDRYGERLGDRGWSSAGDRFSESDRGLSERSHGSYEHGSYERPYERPYERDDRSSPRGQGYRSFDSDRMGRDERDRAGHRDQDYLRDRGGRGNVARPYSDNEDRMPGQRGYLSQGDQRPPGAFQSRGSHRGKGPVGFQRSDERIKELVCEALTDHDDIDASHIDVTVKGGEVTLAGTIEDRHMKRLAEDCVENVPGVKDVQNQLRIAIERKAGSGMTASTEKHEKSADRSDHPDKKHRPS